MQEDNQTNQMKGMSSMKLKSLIVSVVQAILKSLLRPLSVRILGLLLQAIISERSQRYLF